MSFQENVELTDTERCALARLKRDHEPPVALEEAVVKHLRGRGMLASKRRPIAGAALIGAAAAVLVSAIWILAGHRGQPRTEEQRFMLLLYGRESPDAGSALTTRREYARWARVVAERGVTISGDELAEEGEELPSAAAPGQTAATSADRPRGYFIIAAPDADVARGIALGCPHLRHGGRIILRRIVP